MSEWIRKWSVVIITVIGLAFIIAGLVIRLVAV